MVIDRETVLKLAREAYDRPINSPSEAGDALERFAKLVAEHSASVEREACAKVCDALEEMHVEGFVRRRSTNWDCAAAIRARGNT